MRGAAAQSAESLASPRPARASLCPDSGGGVAGRGEGGGAGGRLRLGLIGERQTPTPAPAHPREPPGRTPRAVRAPDSPSPPPRAAAGAAASGGPGTASRPETARLEGGWSCSERLAGLSECRFTKRLASEEN